MSNTTIYEEDYVYSSQEKALTIVPRVSGFLSMCGSALIILDLVRLKQLRTNTQHRLLAGMSTFDFLASAFAFFPGPWMLPADEEAYGASGNQASCEAQGFFGQLIVGAILYSATLSVYYWATIRLQVKGDRMARRWEPFLHGIPCLFALVTASAGIPLELYNHQGTFNCWVAASPLGCDWEGSTTECTRAPNAVIFQWVWLYGPLWASFFVSVACMAMVFCYIYSQEKKANSYNFERAITEQQLAAPEVEDDDDDDDKSSVASLGSKGSKMSALASSTLSKGASRIKKVSRVVDLSDFKYSQRVARQGYLYCAAFLLTWGIDTVFILFILLGVPGPYWAAMGSSLLFPLQGFFNFWVYLLPRLGNQDQRAEYRRLCCCSGSSRPSDDRFNRTQNTTLFSSFARSGRRSTQIQGS